jgi:hypothetical protein
MYHIIEVENVIGEKGFLHDPIDSTNRLGLVTVSNSDSAYQFSINLMLSQMILLADRLEVKSAKFERIGG